MSEKKIKILMAAAELAPFAKEGGLADVTGSLPQAIKKRGHDVRVIMPKYGLVDEKKYKLKKTIKNLEIKSGRLKEKINIWEGYIPKSKVLVYFVENSKYFRFKNVYHTKLDINKRFFFFATAVIQSLESIDFIPDVLHCHDYHTAILTDLVKSSKNEKIRNIKTLLTIHNLKYQGKTGIRTLSIANLKKKSLKTLEKDSQDGDINSMVQGILNADIINTVSRTYAKEILTKEYAPHLDNILKKRKKDLFGIVNGINTELFDPKTDQNIKYNFSEKTLKRKALNKLDLQKKLGLEQNKNIPMIGLVSRLVWQKGLDLIDESFLDLDCQFVFLGLGSKEDEQRLKNLAKKKPKMISTNIKFSLKLAQKIYASSDMFLMPSRFEPCGLGQMIAMRYGTVPIVRKTGGLADTVNSKLGFSFSIYEPGVLFATIEKAIKTYANKDKWLKMSKNCINKDFSWDKSADEYLRLYKKAIRK
ncbi:hypothetical protein C0584_00920 [Candidatus Parcubacteria bacterium]|nr:MAG: hypothetical protein C0584_00920 [Candidatus Parcubacteria bacterium]